ncbi:MAG: murein L,D-transpeptidase catalytic domain family protein [Bdellovibrionaceae bacterium]|nr:murein L,D-transpeptidase catalytic domain family protein [Pseudobdellovibrionaceae bacterium]
MKWILPVCVFISLALTAIAGSLPRKEAYETSLTARFAQQGVPPDATSRALQYLKTKTHRSKFMVIVDYSKPSTEKRLYLMNLVTGDVEKHFVAHGKNSGVRWATRFSNIPDSKQNSLGLAITEKTYVGFHGRSLRLLGVEKSNSLMKPRLIVLHGASYVSDTFLNTHGRLGRSWGCLTVSKDVIDRLIDKLTPGSLVYSYHPALMSQLASTPHFQQLEDLNITDDADIDLPGEEEDLQSQK